MKNNSFDEKSSPIKNLLFKGLGANDNDDEDSPSHFGRNRVMTDQIDNQHVTSSIARAEDVIKSGINRL